MKTRPDTHLDPHGILVFIAQNGGAATYGQVRKAVGLKGAHMVRAMADLKARGLITDPVFGVIALR